MYRRQSITKPNAINIGRKKQMYVGRDMTELSMVAKTDWEDSELAFFHHSLQQIAPYLNSEGVTIHREIILEIENRGGLKRQEADYTHGTHVSYD
jgi:hypothetical protein